MPRFLVLALLLAAGPASAQAVPATQPTPAAPAKASPVKAVASSLSAMAEKARRDAEARERRWDDRMKRVTRSMCIGC